MEVFVSSQMYVFVRKIMLELRVSFMVSAKISRK